MRPRELAPELGSRFPGLVSLDLKDCSRDSTVARLGPVLSQLPHLRELLELHLRKDDLPAAAEVRLLPAQLRPAHAWFSETLR